jgi:predicted dehydrogenase
MAVKLGVVGYGVGGRCFHTPFIEAAEGIELARVVTRSPERRAEVVEDWSDVPVFDSLGQRRRRGHHHNSAYDPA